MSQYFIYLIYVFAGWAFIPFLLFLGMLANKFNVYMGIKNKSKALGQCVELFTFLSLFFLLLPILSEFFSIYERFTSIEGEVVAAKIKARWMFVGLILNLIVIGIPRRKN